MINSPNGIKLSFFAHKKTFNKKDNYVALSLLYVRACGGGGVGGGGGCNTPLFLKFFGI